MPNQTNLERRTMLLAGAAAGAISIVKPSAVRGAEANEKLEIGVIGCGGRAAWLTPILLENTNTKIVAAADFFKQDANDYGDMYEVAKDRRYFGRDGYKQLLEGKLDAVLVFSPPYYHPEHVKAAIAAGKHVYLAKPVAVDTVGCMEILEAAEKQSEKLSLWVDFQTRADQFYQGAAKRVHDGILGRIVTGQVYYHTKKIGYKMEPGSEIARLRNWVFDKDLSGDIIVEQNIHVLDVANWFLQKTPLKAHGTGGQLVRLKEGNCWDHFNIVYWYPDDISISFSSSQCVEGYKDTVVRIYGGEATVDTHYGDQLRIRGKRAGWRGGKTGQIYLEGPKINTMKFCDSIANGKPINNFKESVDSTLTSILGRTAALRTTHRHLG